MKIPFQWKRVLTCGWTDRQTNMTKVIVAFRSLAKGAYKYFRSRQGTEENRIRPMHFVCQTTKA